MALGERLLHARVSEAETAVQTTHAKLPYADRGVVRREQQTAGAERRKMQEADGGGVRRLNGHARLLEVEGAYKDGIT